jgi:hypothetical protein
MALEKGIQLDPMNSGTFSSIFLDEKAEAVAYDIVAARSGECGG